MADDARLEFAEFYARYHRRLLGFAITAYGRGDADDIAQDAMVRAYRSYAHLDPARDPWPWLVAIVRNVARDRYARPAAVPLPDVPLASADATAGVEERAVVRQALGRLSSEDRTLLVLREWHELSFGELGGLFGRSANTMRQHAFRARRRLADAYTDLGGRAMGMLAWLRWRAPVATQVAAVVVAGAVVTAPPVARPLDRPAAPAGPAAHGGTTAGPVVRRAAAPPRRAAPAPRPAPRRTVRVTRPEPPARSADRPPARERTPVSVGRSGTAQRSGTPLVCALTPLCGR